MFWMAAPTRRPLYASRTNFHCSFLEIGTKRAPSCVNKELGQFVMGSWDLPPLRAYGQKGWSRIRLSTPTTHGNNGIWLATQTFVRVFSARYLQPSSRFKVWSSIGLDSVGAVIASGIFRKVGNCVSCCLARIIAGSPSRIPISGISGKTPIAYCYHGHAK